MKYAAYNRCDPDRYVASGIRVPRWRKLDPCASGHRVGGGDLPSAHGQTSRLLTISFKVK